MLTEKKQAYLLVDFQNQPVDLSLIYDILSEEFRISGAKVYGHWSGQASNVLNYAKMGAELVEIPEEGFGNNKKNDVKLMVDAMELLFTHGNVEVFILVAGDLDYHPLIVKLREYGKTVVTIARKKSTSPYIVRLSDRFMAYDEMVKEKDLIFEITGKNLSELTKEVTELLMDRDLKITPENVARVLASMKVNASRFKSSNIHELSALVYRNYKDKSYIEAYENFIKKLIASFNIDGISQSSLVELADKKQRWAFSGDMSLADFVKKLELNGDIVKNSVSNLSIPVPERWDMLLKSELPYPEKLREFSAMFHQHAAKGNRTIREILDIIKDSSGMNSKIVNSLGRLAKFSGKLIGPNQSDYVSFNTVVRIECGEEELLKSLICASIKRLLKVAVIREDDRGDFLRYIAGDDFEHAAEEFGRLLSEGEIELKDHIYYYKR